MEFKEKKINLDFMLQLGGFQYSTFIANLNDEAIVTVFCCVSECVPTIEENWKNISDYISHDYLTGDISEFERWNSYLVFICDDEVPKKLKYEIENDKFYMRKIVVKKPEDWDEDAPEKELIELLNQRLLLTYINLSGYETADAPIYPVLSKWGENVIDEKVPFDPRKEYSKDARSAWIKEALERAMSEVSDED